MHIQNTNIDITTAISFILSLNLLYFIYVLLLCPKPVILQFLAHT